MMPTADEVAVAIVTAARMLGGDGLAKAQLLALATEALTMEPKTNYDAECRITASRVRAYAARALDKVFNGHYVFVARPTIAALVGVNRTSQASYFSSFNQRRVAWWHEPVFTAVVEAVQKAHSDRLEAPREAALPSPPKVAPRPPAKPVAPARTVSNEPAAFEGLDRAAAGFGRPRANDAGGDKQLIGRAEERRKLRDILAEAAANTAKMQDKLSDT